MISLYLLFQMMNKELPLISICILNWNWEERLPKVIPSILKQDYPNLEFLFLDNWSTDKSLDYISQFKKIEVIKNKNNLWISWGRNKLAKHTKWKYILFVDNDVELTTKTFMNQILRDYLSLRNKKTGIIFPIVKLENHENNCEVWLYYNKIQNVKFNDIYKKWLIQKPWFLWTIFFIERKLFFELWCFDEKYIYNMDDQDFSMRLYNAWYTIYVDTNLYIIHHWIEMRSSSKRIWWRYQYYFCWLMRSVLKNYKTRNLIIRTPIIFWRSFVKAFKFSIMYNSLLPLKWFFTSIKYFFRDLSDTLNQRKYWQNKRIIDKDVFLKIK